MTNDLNLDAPLAPQVWGEPDSEPVYQRLTSG